jgi:hypothetical protein
LYIPESRFPSLFEATGIPDPHIDDVEDDHPFNHTAQWFYADSNRNIDIGSPLNLGQRLIVNDVVDFSSLFYAFKMDSQMKVIRDEGLCVENQQYEPNGTFAHIALKPNEYSDSMVKISLDSLNAACNMFVEL